jgi:hypothetical protein
MASATDKIIPGLVPPREETEGVDFLAIYDSFDAETLTDEQLLKFAPKYPLLTGIGGEEFSNEIEEDLYPIPTMPIAVRMSMCLSYVQTYRRSIERAVEKWKNGKKTGYREARAALMRAVEIKACTQYVSRQYLHTTKEEMLEEQEKWDRWNRLLDQKNGIAEVSGKVEE